MNKYINFQNKIVLLFILIFITIAIIFSISIYILMKNSLIQTNQNNLNSIAQKASNQMDTIYKQLSNAALGFTHNQDNLNNIIQIYNETDDRAAFAYKARLALNLNTIYSMLNNTHRILIFIPNKKVFFSYIRDEDQGIKVPDKYFDSGYTSKLFTTESFAKKPVHQDDFTSEPTEVISVATKFNSQYRTDFGYMEIQYPYRLIESIFTLGEQQSGQKIYVFDDTGALLFPSSVKKDVLELHKANAIAEAAILNKKSKNKIPQLSTYRSEYTNWTTVVTMDEELIGKNLQYFRTTIIFWSLFIFVTVIAVYILGIRKMISPLRRLIFKVRKVSLDNLTIHKIEKPVVNEFSLLNDAFEQMLNRLKESINQEYESRIREMEAHTSALQAQINPHFIFNTLNVIAAHSENHNHEIAATMCYKLAEMMRYSIRMTEHNVDLHEELEHSLAYLELVKLHYDDNLTISVDIPQPLLELKVPKLSLQPFVENAVTHGLEHVLPPWHIRIAGEFNQADHWKVIISDNGSGFDESTLSFVQQKVEEYRHNFMARKLMMNSHIEGIGIINTYARLLLCFGENLYFNVENNIDSRGCHVEFGVAGKGGS